jgi:hypothetical protein
MIDKEILIELAKLSGWSVWNNGNPLNPESIWEKVGSGLEPMRTDDFQYLESYDSILRLVIKQSDTVKIHIIHHLFEQTCIKHDDSWQTSDIVAMLSASPRQLCIALLKAVGKWKD